MLKKGAKMQLTIDKTREKQLFNIAKSMNLDPEMIVQNLIDEFLEKQRQKKIDKIAQKIKKGYLEAVEAREKGVKLQTLDELLNEL